MQSNGKWRVYLGLCVVAMVTKFMSGVARIEKLEAVVTPASMNWD